MTLVLIKHVQMMVLELTCSFQFHKPQKPVLLVKSTSFDGEKSPFVPVKSPKIQIHFPGPALFAALTRAGNMGWKTYGMS